MAKAKPPVTRSVDAIVQDIYGLLVDDVSMRPCLQTMGAAFRSHVTGIHSEEMLLRSGRLEMMGEIQGPEFLRMAGEYATRWKGQNLWMERSIPGFLAKGYEHGEAVVSDAELLASEYFRHFCMPMEIRHGLGINVQSDGASSFAILSVNRSASAGPFTPDELSMVEALRPHLVNAYAICRHVARLQEEVTSLRAGFDRMPLGMLVLTADGCIVERNEEATRLLVAGNGFACAAGGGLRLASPAAHAKYRAAMLRLADESQAPMPQAIVVGGRIDSGAGGLVLHLCAFPASAAPVLARKGRVIAFLCELNHHAETQFATRLLRVALDLTPMEAAVALSLRDNHDPAQVALELGMAISTVRSHLKHLFHKTETTKQSELLRLVDRLLSAVPS
jgi:DNA-binding CsgD family transcriptional regulator